MPVDFGQRTLAPLRHGAGLDALAGGREIRGDGQARSRGKGLHQLLEELRVAVSTGDKTKCINTKECRKRVIDEYIKELAE